MNGNKLSFHPYYLLCGSNESYSPLMTNAINYPPFLLLIHIFWFLFKWEFLVFCVFFDISVVCIWKQRDSNIRKELLEMISPSLFCSQNTCNSYCYCGLSQEMLSQFAFSVLISQILLLKLLCTYPKVHIKKLKFWFNLKLKPTYS